MFSRIRIVFLLFSLHVGMPQTTKYVEIHVGKVVPGAFSPIFVRCTFSASFSWQWASQKPSIWKAKWSHNWKKGVPRAFQFAINFSFCLCCLQGLVWGQAWSFHGASKVAKKTPRRSQEEPWRHPRGGSECLPSPGAAQTHQKIDF